MPPGVAVPLTLALLLALSGCLSLEAAPWREAVVGAESLSEPWSPGSWWSYHATFRSGRGLDVALVVHAASPDGFRLGTNLSAGFFGLPFNGTVTRGYNPVVSDEEWRLFDFPLGDGKAWEQQLFGYPVRTVARRAAVEMPDGRSVPGFEMTSTSYGREFARYAWSEEAAWFTRLALFEPTDGTRVLDVRLTGHGDRFGQSYFVEVPLERLGHEYPALDGPDVLPLPGDLRVAAQLTLRGTIGEFQARLLSPRGSPVLHAAVHGQGVDLQRATFTSTEGRWRLEHLGLGQGSLRLELTAIVQTGEGPAAEGTAEPVDLVGLLAGRRSLPAVGLPALDV